MISSKCLKQTVQVPIHLHTHYTTGMASMGFLKAVEAGVDIMDCCMAPFALRTSHPAVEPIVVALEGTPVGHGSVTSRPAQDQRQTGDHRPQIPRLLDHDADGVIDMGVLVHQMPGGMICNLVSQLKENKTLHRLAEVYQELPAARRKWAPRLWSPLPPRLWGCRPS